MGLTYSCSTDDHDECPGVVMTGAEIMMEDCRCECHD